MIVMLVALSMLLYSPFNQLFHPGYNQIGIWTGDRTPLSSYFTHWGLLCSLSFLVCLGNLSVAGGYAALCAEKA